MTISFGTGNGVEMVLVDDADAITNWSGSHDGLEGYGGQLQGSDCVVIAIRKNETIVITLNNTTTVSTTNNQVICNLASAVGHLADAYSLVITDTNNGDSSSMSFLSDINGLISPLAFDGNSGSCDLDTYNFEEIVITWDAGGSNVKAADNIWMDAVYVGNGVDLTGTTTSDLLFTEGQAYDESSDTYNGILTEKEGIIFCQGDVFISATSGKSYGETLVFYQTSNGHNDYHLTGDGTIDLQNTNILVSGTCDLTINTSSATSFDMAGGTIVGALSVTFGSDDDVNGVIFTSCTTINNGGCNSFTNNVIDTTTTLTISSAASDCTLTDITNLTLSGVLTDCNIFSSDQIDLTVSGSGLSGCTIDETDHASALVVWDGAKTLANNDFQNTPGSKHCVELTSYVSSITWSNTFNTTDFPVGTAGESGTDWNFGTDGDEAIYLNFTSSSDITINSADGTTPSIRKAAGYTGTVTITAAANPKIDVTVKNSAGTPIQYAWVYIHDGVSQINNTQTDSNGEITQIDYSGGQSTSTLRVRIWGYYHFETIIDTSTTANIGVTLVEDAQQSGSAPTLTDTWTDVPASETVGWSSGTNIETVNDVYGWLMNKYAAETYMQYQSPMKSVTARQYEFINGWNFTNTTDYQKLKGGTIIDTATDQQWSNVVSIGSIESGTGIYIIQDDTLIPSAWWSSGHIDILVEVRNSSGTWIQSTDDSQTAINGGIWVFAREYGDLYTSYFVDLSGGGRSVIPISTSNDPNNTTSNTTVAAYTIGITTNFTTLSRSLDGGDNYYNYRVEFDLNGHTLEEFYEYTKWMTSFDYSQTIDSDNGYEYRNAYETDASFTGSDVAVAPFGTFAGGKFFGARGVFIHSMDTDDATNYQLIDNLGNDKYPPALVPLGLSGVTEGTAIIMIANATVGAVTTGDILLQGFADSSGELNTTFTYEGDLDIIVRARNQGIACAAISDDGGVFDDQTEEAASSVDTAEDMTILPAAPLVDDAYYFGHTEKFNQIKLNISTAIVQSSSTLVWEYWNGSWTALSGVVDATNGFENSGNGIISYTLPSDWVTTTVNTTQGPYYYVRVRLSVLGSVTTAPKAKWVTLDASRYLPYNASRVISSTGLSDIATWTKDIISVFI